MQIEAIDTTQINIPHYGFNNLQKVLKLVLDAAETNQDFQIVREAVEEFETLVSEKEKPNAAITKYIHDVMELPAECMQRKEKDQVVAQLLQMRKYKCKACRLSGHQTSACWLNWQMRDYSVPEIVRLSWDVYKEVRRFRRAEEIRQIKQGPHSIASHQKMIKIIRKPHYTDSWNDSHEALPSSPLGLKRHSRDQSPKVFQESPTKRIKLDSSRVVMELPPNPSVVNSSGGSLVVKFRSAQLDDSEEIIDPQLNNPSGE